MNGALRLQSSLGKVYQDSHQDMFMNGYLTVAKVLKVHHKSNTADVVVVNTKDTITSSHDNEGRFSARIVTSMSGYDNNRKKSWGAVEPIMVGTLVLLGFLDNMKSRPIILGKFHEPDSSANISTLDYPLNPEKPGYQRREALKSLHVYPSQAYRKLDGEGNIEFSHPSKSFLAMYNTSADSQDYLNDSHRGFDHEHLSETDPQTGEPLETDFEEAKTPLKSLFVHRSSFDNEVTTWTKFFLKEDGTFRITRDNNDEKLTFMEIAKNGTWKIRRNVDTSDHEGSKNYGEVVVEGDGSAYFQRIINDKSSVIGLDGNGNIILETDGSIISTALTRFIENNHLIVSDDEPENPPPGLIWIDTSDD